MLGCIGVCFSIAVMFVWVVVYAGGNVLQCICWTYFIRDNMYIDCVCVCLPMFFAACVILCNCFCFRLYVCIFVVCFLRPVLFCAIAFASDCTCAFLLCSVCVCSSMHLCVCVCSHVCVCLIACNL